MSQFQLMWEINHDCLPEDIMVYDGRMMVFANNAISSYHIGKNTKRIWKKRWQVATSKHFFTDGKAYCFNENGYYEILDFWTGECLLSNATNKYFLDIVPSNDLFYAAFGQSIGCFDTKLYCWSYLLIESCKKILFCENMALVQLEDNSLELHNLKSGTIQAVALEKSPSLLDAKCQKDKIFCLTDKGIAILDDCGTVLANFGLCLEAQRMVDVYGDSILLSADNAFFALDQKNQEMIWLKNFPKITASCCENGVLCIGDECGLAQFIDISQGRLLSAFEGTSSICKAKYENNLWLLVCSDGSIFALVDKS